MTKTPQWIKKLGGHAGHNPDLEFFKKMVLAQNIQRNI